MEKTGKRLRGIHKHFDKKAHKINIKGPRDIQGETLGERERERGWTHTE